MADFTIAQMYDQYDRVTEGKNRITYGYHVDWQLATVTKGKVTENFQHLILLKNDNSTLYHPS